MARMTRWLALCQDPCMTVSPYLVSHKKQLWYKIDARNQKSTSKIARWPSFTPLTLKSGILLKFEFLTNYKDLHEKCCWRARSVTQQHFPYKSFKCLKIQTAIKTHSSIPYPQTWPFWYFWHALMISGVCHETWQFFIIEKVLWHSHAKGLLMSYCYFFVADKEYRDLYEKTEKVRLEWDAAMLKFCKVRFFHKINTLCWRILFPCKFLL